MKSLMKIIVCMALFDVSAGHAMPTGEGDGTSLLGYLFLGFFALIVVSQLVPAAILFYGMVKSIFFARGDKKAVE